MRVRLWIKTHENPSGNRSEKGDIVEILPYDIEEGRLVQRNHYPVDMDLTVPCGDNFRQPFQCNNCEHNHPDTCDIQKYKSAVWTAGDVVNPPRVAQKRKYKIDLDNFIPPGLVVAAMNRNKTPGQINSIREQANSSIFNRSTIVDKTASASKLKTQI